jgi:hypothetical protein
VTGNFHQNHRQAGVVTGVDYAALELDEVPDVHWILEMHLIDLKMR